MKKFLLLVALLLLVGAGGAAYLFLSKDKLIKDAVEAYGPELTGTEVKLALPFIEISRSISPEGKS